MRRGLATSRERARELVDSGSVTVSGAPALKPSRLVDPADPIEVSGPPPPYVSRGGVKLAGALDAFGIDVTRRRCLDAGASTGGFTDCLLQRGASSVVAVDVGRGQLDWSLRNDARVTAMERTDIRSLGGDAVGEVDLVVADLSFISLRTVMPALAGLARGADLVVLVKPQFEVGRASVGKGGVVRDDALRAGAVDAVAAAAGAAGLCTLATAESSIAGADGNREVFLHLRRPA